MNYVILQKARPYTRTKKGKLERVKGYQSRTKTGKPKVGDTRICKIEGELAQKEQKRVESIFRDIQSSFRERLKKIAPNCKVRFNIYKGEFSDWKEEYSTWKFWVPVEKGPRPYPWIEWEIIPPKEYKYGNKWSGRGSLGFYPASLEPDNKERQMSFKVGDSEFGTELKNKGLYSSIFSVLAEARDKGWLENRLYVHVGLGTKAWNKLAKKFNFPYIGNEMRSK